MLTTSRFLRLQAVQISGSDGALGTLQASDNQKTGSQQSGPCYVQAAGFINALAGGSYGSARTVFCPLSVSGISYNSVLSSKWSWTLWC